MATNRPRITITLTERQHDILRSLSEFGGKPMSAFVVELLDVSLPTLERLAATMQAISKARQTDIDRIRDQIDEAQRVFEPMAMAVVAQSDMFLGRVEQAAAGAGGQVPPAPAAARSTPPTNRGVTPTPEKPLKPKPRKASSELRSRSQPASRKGVKRASV